ncbi:MULTISPECIES: hypothetical protein [unclassified Sphingomonas]|uniref:tetratricopeptide repeat protein n=1 Tax=unclassified Sphingomonas TaxID=196159 RepID=UPI00226A81D6|nr:MULTISPECIES: hypothetical protein [unclassified Sphingomonas]
MGWLWLALIGGVAMGGLIALRVPRTLWSFAGAALMLAAAGYALQGSPNLPAHPAITDARVARDDPGIIDLRDRMFGRFTNDGAYLIAADAMLGIGDRKAALQAILGGIRAVPKSAMLWTALGGSLAMRDGGVVSPPSRFAFDQAMRLAPRHPGPPFFAGLAYIRSGDFMTARACWRRALRLAPAGASYRRDIAMRLSLLENYLARMPSQPPR